MPGQEGGGNHGDAVDPDGEGSRDCQEPDGGRTGDGGFAGGGRSGCATQGNGSGGAAWLLLGCWFWLRRRGV